MTTLEEAYDFLEKKAIGEKYSHHLSQQIQEVRDYCFKNNQEEEGKKAQYELDFLNFNIRENKLSFLFSSTDSKGDLVEYPSIKLFTEDTYNYLQKRQVEVVGPLIKARYSHILWLSPKKRIEFAETAIKSYLKLISIREQQDKENPQDHFGLQVLEIIENAFLLSMATKFQIDKVKAEILRIVREYSFESSSTNVIRFQLIELMLKHKSIFIREDFLELPSICETLYEKIYKSGNKHMAIDMLILIGQIEKKLGNDFEKWERRIGELWEELIDDRKDVTNLVSTEFCKNAIKQYKKIKDFEKVKELEKRFDVLRKNLILTEFGQEFDLTEMMSKFRKYADHLSNQHPFAIINSLTFDKNLLPSYDIVLEQGKESVKNHPLLYMGTTSIIDENGNHSQYFSEQDEQEYYAMMSSYNMSLQVTHRNLIREIFFACMRKHKITPASVLLFLKKYSWFGKELNIESNHHKRQSYNWLSLIAPALNEYFTNLEFYFRNPNNYPNLVLCIDSLTLKIEGMLRDICKFKGITTYELRSDRKNRTISQEKDIHKLLYEEEIKSLFDKDDLLFFKFLLVEKAGYNLRHKVAHSLMKFDEYHIDYVNLLILAILRIGKYDFVPVEDNDETKMD